jgi:hypothetical protein
MWRLLLAALLFAGLTLGTSVQALAIDYDEPFVPPQFLLTQPAPAPPAETGTVTLLRLQEGEAPRPAAPAVSAPVGSGSAGYGSSGCSDIGGRALWNWNAC